MSRWVGVGFVLIFSSYFGFRFQSLNLYVKMFSQYHGGKLTFIVEMELRLKAMIKAKRRSGEAGGVAVKAADGHSHFKRGRMMVQLPFSQ